MQRRNFLIGVSSTAVAGSALLGTGAFSRVESQRNVAIQVATDDEAYLGMGVIDDSLNSTNFAELDGNGHLAIDIGDFGADGSYDYDTGVGVNSDSFTYFDDLFRLCNNGKADAEISYELPDPDTAGHPSLDGSWQAPDPNYDDEQVVAFYWVDGNGDRVIVDEGQTVPLPLGECENIGLRTVTKGIDATDGRPLLDGTVVITADSPEAGEVTTTTPE
ncbi:hypothetical protein KY092_18860 [Natronomonas gomsonensis]|uniref:hypothetical protein n=1 Tax=Natronomonas gomsonensis TaxID=1046043 RepID=UPI00227AD417|nr:hypothetical protein [Natronomonas gomsonensis]MCY4732605.1 hypothetical protein [Natronomonas gomsonensis]